MPNRKLNLIIVTGMSGAGKSQAANALEDMGYFCVDNLPPTLFEPFLAGIRSHDRDFPPMAVVADIRSGPSGLAQVESVLTRMREGGLPFGLLFMEAPDEVLLRRYQENRRPHPLSQIVRSGLADCIREERRLLTGLRAQADYVLDTGSLRSRNLAEQLRGLMFPANRDMGASLSIVSFGFKYGLPGDADLVVDMRFLPNPFYVPELKALTGKDSAVFDYVMESEAAGKFLHDYVELLRSLLPLYLKEGKGHLTLAIGCTGGQHRSVAMAEAIYQAMSGEGWPVWLDHRDLWRSQPESLV